MQMAGTSTPLKYSAFIKRGQDNISTHTHHSQVVGLRAAELVHGLKHHLLSKKTATSALLPALCAVPGRQAGKQAFRNSDSPLMSKILSIADSARGSASNKP